ncbi:MAG TPA: peptide-methionine (R)-S-oxide reductase MsrB [SAR86 cluster bacterium]|nr:peptide-methionine (R)-S-oxide reductase MsrB [SAR86 cluster bacterium]
MTENGNEKLKDGLSPEEYYVTQKKGTEPAFSGKYDGEKTAGVYNCVVCGEGLFSSETKYDSGSGWPSFWEPINQENIGSEEDHSAGMVRTEVHCSKCKSHLGHVFPDGPQPSGLRYCINSVSLDLKADDEVED